MQMPRQKVKDFTEAKARSHPPIPREGGLIIATTVFISTMVVTVIRVIAALKSFDRLS